MFAINFKNWNIIFGWVVFFIAFLTYSITVAPTVSFWDAGEYIATSSKLQVAHSPGAPLLQIIGAFFSMFALEPKQIAKCVNYVSVLSSAFTILFMYWTITNFTRKLISRKEMLTNLESIMVLVSGLVGSLAFTYSDSFWFNATETEVYASASFIMALLLWLGIKWTDSLHTPRGNRWLVLISFVVGLTFGIQFMGFLAIPSLGLLYYFKKYETTTVKNFLIANITVVAVLMLVFKFSLTYVLKLFGWSEVFFVNIMGLPFNSGSIIMGVMFVLFFYLILRYTNKKKYRNANTLALCSLFLCLGFSSWLMLPIRASAKVVINENDPSDARSLLAYYNREQYSSTDSPFYGAYYSDMFASMGEERDDKPKYERDVKSGKYIIVNHYKNAYRDPNKNHMGILPRMWSDRNAAEYIEYFGELEFKIKPIYQSNTELQTIVNQFKKEYLQGEIGAKKYIDFLNDFSDYIDVAPPSVWENVEYMFKFQFGYMYWRYFMWNFVGRQNDIQGKYDDNGNWLSGINFVDNWRLGSQENLSSAVKNNKGRNTYFFLPLILGIIGIVFQIVRDPKQFWVLFVFFVFTGIAIQFYTNPAIFQVRERDYSLVGSFYIFAIWIGLGVYGLFDEFIKRIPSKIVAPVITIICLFAVPGVMGHQNWDDHDRSNRFTALSMSKAYLDSTQEDSGAILFTIGDNDTFPLWYAQEIEGYRTDTRIIISGYLNFSWYIDQMKRKAYESDPIPSQLIHELYRYGSRDAIYYKPLTDKRWLVKDFMNWVASDKPQTKIKSLLEKEGADVLDYPEGYLNMVYYPTNKIRIPVHKKNVLESGLVKEKDTALIVDYIDIDLPKTGISKGRVMMLDIIANNDWKRSIYFSGGSFDEEEYLWMLDYLQLDGLVYKLVPIKTKNQSIFDKGRIDGDLMYDIVKKWEWGNSGNPNIYHDPQTRRQGGVSFRISIARLVETLIKENKIDKAKDVLDIAIENLPLAYFEYYTFVEPFVDGYYKVGETLKARKLFHKLKIVYQERLEYYANVPLKQQYRNIENIIADLLAYQRIITILNENMDQELAKKETSVFNVYLDEFSHFVER
ncbi:MAG: hypothetical protein COA50_05225 [Flavobacteriaceae bacterium]|nr:MAG: hypothetical protein COA50_05225 [Flavobacteriaceae bacterium]